MICQPRRVLAAIGAVPFLSAAMMLAPAFAQADTQSCGATVIDTTSSHVLGEGSQILAAAKTLDNHGLVVRVRAFQTAPGGSLQSYLSSQTASCATWRGPDGKMLGNLVVFMFSMDHQSGIVYGGNESDRLNPVIDQIRGDMNAQFRDGQFADGIAGAEQAVKTQLTNPSAQSGSNSQQGGGGSGAGLIFVWLIVSVVAFAVLIFVIMVALRVHKSRVEARENLARAKTKAQTAYNDAVAAIGQIENTSDIRRSVELVSPQLARADRAALDQAWTAASGQADAAMIAYTRLSDRGSAMDPAHDHSLAEYDEITAQYTEVTTAANEAAEAVRGVDEHCTQLQTAMDQAPATLAELTTGLAAARTAHQAFVADGFQSVDGEDLETADAALANAQTLIGQRKHGEALGPLEVADTAINDVNGRVQAVRKRKSDLASRHAQLSQQAVAAGADNAATTEELQELASNYAASCLEGLATSQILAATLAGVNTDLADASHAFAMSTQAWDRSDEQLDGAEHGLVTCEQHRAGIQSRSEDLAKIARTSRDRLRKLKEAMATLSTNIDSRHGHQDDCRSRASALNEQITAIERLLADDRPDYLAFKQQVDDAIAELKAIDKDSHDAYHAWARRQGNYRMPSYSSAGGDGYLNGFVAAELIQSSYSSGSSYGGDYGSSSGGGFSDPGGSIGGWGGGGDSGGSVGGW